MMLENDVGVERNFFAIKVLIQHHRTLLLSSGAKNNVEFVRLARAIM